MRVVDTSLLSEFAAARVCGWCKRPLRFPAHPHHLFARGFGGGSRLDVRVNLIALGGPLDCNCHGSHHDGNRPLRCDLLAVVAQREGLLQGQIEETVWRLLRTPKERRA